MAESHCPYCDALHTEKNQPFECWLCNEECCDKCLVDTGDESLCPDCAADWMEENDNA